MPTFQLIAIQAPKWFFRKANKIIRAFLWAIKDHTSGGKCLVNWDLVCSPTEFGGLGVLNLQFHSNALKIRWLWQSWMSTEKPWLGLPLPVDSVVQQLFFASVEFHIGSGELTPFWHTPWLLPKPFKDIWPELFKHCTKRSLSIKDALADNKWIRHLKRQMSPLAVIQFTELWEAIQPVVLHEQVPDTIRWRWTPNGEFSVQSAYLIQFEGRTRTWLPSTVWNSSAPLKCKFFGWLASLNRCLTADNMAKRGWMCDPICRLCRLSNESGLHLFLLCPFSRQVWDLVQAKLQITLNPKTDDATELSRWWFDQVAGKPKNTARSLNAVLNLVCWSIWKERNSRTFSNLSATPFEVFSKLVDEAAVWHHAGRSGLDVLAHRPREPD